MAYSPGNVGRVVINIFRAISIPSSGGPATTWRNIVVVFGRFELKGR